MRRRPSTALIVIVLLALAVRVGVVIATPGFTPIFDAADFDRHAVSIASGHGYPKPQLAPQGPSAFRPPLYPLALAVVHKAHGGQTALRLLGALLGAVTVGLIYLLAARIWNRRVAAVAGGMAAVFPPLVVLSASYLSELLFIPLVLAATLAAFGYRNDPRIRWAAAAGVLTGLAALTRTNGLLLVVALGIGVWILRPLFSRRALAAPAVLAVAAALTVTPWVIRNAVVFHRFVGIGDQTGYALAGTYNSEARQMAEHPGQPRAPHLLESFRPVFARSDLDEAERFSRLNDAAVDFIGEHPAYVPQTMAWNVLRVFDIERTDSYERVFQAQTLQAVGMPGLASLLVPLSLYVVTALAGLGTLAVALRLGHVKGPPLFFWLVPLMMVLPALAVYGLARYRAPVDPFLVMLAAFGLVAVYDRVRDPARARG